jgi:hypothetical protein
MSASTSLATVMFTGLVVAGAACGSSAKSTTSNTTGGTGGESTTGTTSTGTTSSSTTTTGAGGAVTTVDAGALKFPFPLVSWGGAPLITAADVVTVTFEGDTLATQLAPFGAGLTSSAYWNAITPGYCSTGTTCIGDGAMGSAVALTMQAGASYTDSALGGASTIQTLLQGLITAEQVPAPTANTIYALYFPSTTSITLDGSPSCGNGGFDAYHNSMQMGSQQVIYAIIPECAAPQMTPTIDLLQNTTISASHEVIEAASDGYETNTTYGYYLDGDDPNTWGWNDIQGGEIADLCVDPFLLGLDETTDGTYTVQRIWSITEAAAGKNPCVPVPTGEVYFNTYPSATVIVTDVGTSKTIDITALADSSSMGEWTVLAQDWTIPNDPNMTAPFVTFSIEGGTTTSNGPQIQMKSGDTVKLTVTLAVDPGANQQQTTGAAYGEADAVLVSANGTQQTTTAAHFWPFIVLTPAEAAAQGVSMQKHIARPRKLSHSRARAGWRGFLPSAVQ